LPVPPGGKFQGNLIDLLVVVLHYIINLNEEWGWGAVCVLPTQCACPGRLATLLTDPVT
jgi:hypothetical protein